MDACMHQTACYQSGADSGTKTAKKRNCAKFLNIGILYTLIFPNMGHIWQTVVYMNWIGLNIRFP